FAVEVLYLASSEAWPEKGRVSISLPAADLPISRTGLTLYYPPLYRITPEPGSFRPQPEGWQASEVLNDAPDVLSRVASPVFKLFSIAGAPTARRIWERPLPNGLTFPEIGPSLQLAAELTEENKRPSVDLVYQKQ